MPDWSNPTEVIRDGEILQNLLLALLGLYTWEIITQLPFDWSIISRKRQVHWPSLFYFHCKYSLWLGVVGASISTIITIKVNCQALFTFNQVVINTSIGSASTLLMLRTIAVWKRSPFVMIPLGVASLGQWGLLFHGIVVVKGSWSNATGKCLIDAVPPLSLVLIYLYTMSFDLLVLLLTTIGLVMSPGRSSLWQLLFRQGMIYFVIAFLANLISTIFLLLNLNQVMNIIFSVPAAVASSIVACRAFISLTNFGQKDVYVHTARYVPTRLRPNEGRGSGPSPATVGGGVGGGLSDGCDASFAKKRRGIGNMIAGITFRNMAAGIDSMGPVGSTDDLDISRTGILAVSDSGHERDVGGTDESCDIWRQ